MMGADYYERRVSKNIPLGIGKRCEIEGAIIDKNVQIGDGVVIHPSRAARTSTPEPGWCRTGSSSSPRTPSSRPKCGSNHNFH